MTTTAVPAADLGLPNATRRRLLMGLAAASTAAAGGVAYAGTAPEESAELLSMPAKVQAAVDEALRAEADKDAIFAEWDPRMPAPPAELQDFRGACGWTFWKHLDGRERQNPAQQGGPIPRRFTAVTLSGLEGRQKEIERFMRTSKRLAEGKTWHGKLARNGSTSWP